MTEEFRWIPTKEKNPSQSGVYKCTLKCHNRENDIGRDLCVDCKRKWLLQEVDK